MIRIGPAGWSYADWEGVVYPRKKPRAFHPLGYLARFVECVEVNSSFYAAPRAAYAERWVAQVESRPAFRFAAKLQDVFTHKPLPRVREFEGLAHTWLEGIEPLRLSGKLAAVLVQFPISFQYSRAGKDRLERIESVFGHLPLVLEVRHRSWFDSKPLRIIEQLGFSLAHIDLPSAKDHPPARMPSIGPLGYLRVHGRNSAAWFDRNAGRDERYDYLYSPREIAELWNTAARIDGEVAETLVITNNHFAGQAVTNAIELMAERERVVNAEAKPLRAPAELVAAYPRLRDCAIAMGQDTLF